MPTPDTTIIIIPTYNEADNIQQIIKEIFEVVPAISVLVVDDNSPDHTADLVRALQTTYPRVRVLQRQQERGFARSYIAGFNLIQTENQYEALVMMDADFSHDPHELPAMLRQLDNADMVLGSRYIHHQEFTAITWWRRYLSKFANGYVRTILQLPVSDCTSGFIAMYTHVLTAINPQTTNSEGYGFLVELKYRAHRAKLRLIDHPVDWPNRHKGTSKMSKKIIIESALLPWRIRFAPKAPLHRKVLA